jgi:hypothetical protein
LVDVKRHAGRGQQRVLRQPEHRERYLLPPRDDPGPHPRRPASVQIVDELVAHGKRVVVERLFGDAIPFAQVEPRREVNRPAVRIAENPHPHNRQLRVVALDAVDLGKRRLALVPEHGDCAHLGRKRDRPGDVIVPAEPSFARRRQLDERIRERTPWRQRNARAGDPREAVPGRAHQRRAGS